MKLILLILGVAAGIFCHYAARWKQGRTKSTFKEYMLGEWVGTLHSVLWSISIVTSTYLATPDISGNLLIAAVYGAFMTGYTFDSLAKIKEMRKLCKKLGEIMIKKLLMICFVTIGICSCSPALINIPKQECPEIITVAPPPEVPENLVIKDSKIEDISDEAFLFLKWYHDVRLLLKNSPKSVIQVER